MLKIDRSLNMLGILDVRQTQKVVTANNKHSLLNSKPPSAEPPALDVDFCSCNYKPRLKVHENKLESQNQST